MLKFSTLVLFTSIVATTNAFAQEAPAAPVEYRTKCEVRFMGSMDDDTLGKFLDEIAKPEVCQDSHQPLKIKIQSGGGMVDPMIFTYIQLRERAKTAKITTQIDHSSASSAVLLFLAGDERLMRVDSKLLVHKISGYISADPKDRDLVREQIEDFDETEKDYIAIVSDRTGMSKEEVKKLMDSRKHLSAEEAMKYGFATGIVK